MKKNKKPKEQKSIVKKRPSSSSGSKGTANGTNNKLNKNAVTKN